MRGLLAIEPLYHQIVSGNKTQTRRSGGLEEVNVQGIEGDGLWDWSPDDWGIKGATVVHDEVGFGFEAITFINKKDESTVRCKPRYKIGEVLYLKEPFIFLESDKVDFWNGYAYKFGARHGAATSDRGCELGGPDFKWKNKLFMPAAAARAFIRITGIRCERLMDISDEDCIAEGIEICESIPIQGERYKGYKNYLRSKNGGRDMLHSCEYYVDMFPHRPDLSAKRSSFLSLYKFANKVKEVPNLWVWVYSFEYIKNYKGA